MRSHRGVTLPEVLVALGVVSTAMLLLGDLVVGSAGWSGHLQASTNGRQLGALTLEVLRHEVAMAGRSINGDGLVVTQRAIDGGDLLGVHYLAEAYRSEPALQHRRFFAARDGQGSWNLYGQRVGATRQPWIAGVRRLSVTAMRTEAGVITSPMAWNPGEVATALYLEVLLSDGTEVGDWLAVHTPVSWLTEGDP